MPEVAEDEPKGGLTLALPGEWALKKVLGPTLDVLGADLARVYAAGRDRIIQAAARKTPNLEDGASANLRIAHDVFSNGGFAESEIASEYFGGVLASSRGDGRGNDNAIYFSGLIKSLSSGQLSLHYAIYFALNQLLASGTFPPPHNLGLQGDVDRLNVWLPGVSLMSLKAIKLDVDFQVLYRLGLISQYEHNVRQVAETSILAAHAKPTSLGFQLYAVAHNRLANWSADIVSHAFEPFDGIPVAEPFAPTFELLAAALQPSVGA
jgi:hypothetical protein